MSETIPIEVSAIDANNITVESIDKTFLDIIQNSLLSAIMTDKLMKTQVNLSPELIVIIKNILSVSPDFFIDIEKAVNEVIKDNKIDSKDIPQFIIVVQKIYEIIYSLKDMKFDNKKCSEFTAIVLKYIIHLLVLERKIKIDEDKEEQFLKDCDVLIDACIGLLSFPKSIKIKGCFYTFRHLKR